MSPVAQRIEHTPPKRGVGGSNPLWDARKHRCKAFFSGFAAFFLFLFLPVISLRYREIFMCRTMHIANRTRPLFRNFAKRNFCGLLIRFSDHFAGACAAIRGLRAHLPAPATSKLLHKVFKVQGRRLRFCRFFRWADIAKIRLIGIEGWSRISSIDLLSSSNVSIDTGYHVDLGMACIAPGGFQIAVVQF